MQIFIILNQHQKFYYNSPKIAEFLKYIALIYQKC